MRCGMGCGEGLGLLASAAYQFFRLGFGFEAFFDCWKRTDPRSAAETPWGKLVLRCNEMEEEELACHTGPEMILEEEGIMLNL